MLQIRHVSKTYGAGQARVQALSDVTLTVQPGSLVAVMGPSGSGKSSLLAIAGSLEQPTVGDVLLDGMPVSSLPKGKRARLRRRDIGYVFQDFNLLPGLTAAENVALPLELDGHGGRKALLAALHSLDELGLADCADRYPAQLSGGERQRIAVARAMAGERRLLLADEPSGSLDSLSGETVMRMVRRACRNGMAAVLVTHDARFASWADRVVFLSDGRLIDETAPPDGPGSLLSGVTYAG